MDEPKTTDSYVAALLRERAGYVYRGLSDRAEQVTAELKRVGYTDPPEEAEREAPKGNAPRGRRAGQQATAG
jgi:hypothetical protein